MVNNATDPNASLDPNAQQSGFMVEQDPLALNTTTSNRTASSAQALVAGPNLQIVTPDQEVVQNRMVFSTVNEEVRGAKPLILRNTGDAALTITLNLGDSQEKNNAVPGRLIDHERAADFRILNTPTGTPFTLNPGASLNVSVQFAPQRQSLSTPTGITDTLNGENYASLNITSNDPDLGIARVNLAGLNAGDYESSREPSVAEISRTLGYGIDIGAEHDPLISSKLLGDEVYSPYWVRADANSAAELFPVAVFSSRSDVPHDRVDFRLKGTTKDNLLYLFAGRNDDDNVPGSNNLSGGENQKLLPKIMTTPFSDSVTPTSNTVDFSPSGPFTLKRGDGFMDDNLNGPAKTHGFRTYAMRDADGVIVPNTWLVTTDIGTNVGRNGDYQDVMWVMKNARPENAALDPARGGLVPGADGLIQNFNQAYPGSLKDKDGQTIGFTGVQLNNTDGYTPTTSYKPALLDIDPNTSVLKVTSTAGGNGSDNNLVNGLQTTFDGRAGRSVVSTKLLGDLSYLNAGFEQAGVMIGPNDDNFMKLVARALPGGGVGLEFYKEIQGVGDRMGNLIPIANPSALQSLELMLYTDPQAKTVRAGYNAIYNTGANSGVVPLSSFVSLKGDDFGRFLTAQSKAGILTSNKGGTPFTATFDRFAVERNETPIAARNVLARYDVGSNSSFPAPTGWSSDAGLFTPSDAPSEIGAGSQADIANTTNDTIYRTYRARIPGVSQTTGEAVLSYNFPLASGKYDVRLHFAEIFFGVPGGGPAGSGVGSRVFDINIEGKNLLQNFDITAAAGGAMTAIVVPIEDIQVNDGVLNLNLNADVNYGAISGIEILKKV
ncbi:MAG: malectin [Gloeocapsa sp. UFS-A4-WI-NPMV-4B04]|nr:malectin [Gloeocapsa sp. UFS-A4-WI-NPMV-4B04]